MKTFAFVVGGIVMMSWFGSLLSAEGIDEKKSFAVGGIKGIRTELDSVNLAVAPAKDDTLTVHLHGESWRAVSLAADVDNGILVVSVQRSAKMPIYEKLAVDISIPAASAKRLSLTTTSTSGNLEMGSLELASYAHTSTSGRLISGDLHAEQVSVNVTSGSVRIGRLDAAKLNVTGSSANIVVEGCHVAEASVETTSGNVALRDCSGSIHATSRSGNVLLDYASFARQDTMIETTSGSATLVLPADAEFSIEARSASGRIQSDFPLNGGGPFEGKVVIGTVGDGANKISIRTTSGGIRISRR